MKNHRFCPNKKTDGRIHQKHSYGPHRKNLQNDQEQLLFELFKLYLRAKREEESHQTQNIQNDQQNEAEQNKNISVENPEYVLEEGSKNHCHRFGNLKKGM